MANEEQKRSKSNMLRNILVVIVFVVVSIGVIMGVYNYIFSRFIDNTVIGVALSIVVGAGFAYFFMTVITETKLIKK